jgi:hypothetical protein
MGASVDSNFFLNCKKKPTCRCIDTPGLTGFVTIRLVWLQSKNPSSTGVRHVPNGTILKALKTCYFSCFSDAQIQSNPNEKLFCLLEHLSIDVVKLRLGLYGWNPRIHQAPVCDMCQNERF